MRVHLPKVVLPLLVAFAPGDLPLSAAEPLDYSTRVKPILAAHCYECHGALKQENGLRLDTGALARKGGESGPAVVAGQPAKSLLLERVQADDKTLRMPPEGEGQRLTPEQLKVLVEWIRQGAVSPESEARQVDPRTHWAFQPPRRRKVDLSAESRNPIDDYIAAGLKRRRVVRL